MATIESDARAAAVRALNEGAGLLDRSERGKLALTGSGAIEFLNGQVTNELEGLAPGEGRYAAFLTHKGKMLGDLRILARPGELVLDTERVSLQALFDMIRRYRIGFDVELHKRTLERGLLSLIGPESAQIAGVGDLPAHEHANLAARVGGVEVLAIRTDTGVDLLCGADETERLAGVLRDAGAQAVDEQAAECLRIERGRPRFGVDLQPDAVIPQEAGLNERAVSFTKGCYVGQETVARLHYKGKPNRHLRGLRLSAPVPAGSELRLGERVLGTLTSVARSPRLGAIGLALVRREAAPGDVLAAGPAGVDAEVVELPFAGAS